MSLRTGHKTLINKANPKELGPGMQAPILVLIIKATCKMGSIVKCTTDRKHNGHSINIKLTYVSYSLNSYVNFRQSTGYTDI